MKNSDEESINKKVFNKNDSTDSDDIQSDEQKDNNFYLHRHVKLLETQIMQIGNHLNIRNPQSENDEESIGMERKSKFKHKLIPKQLSCSVCSKKFRVVSGVLDHLKKVHNTIHYSQQLNGQVGYLIGDKIIMAKREENVQMFIDH